MELDNTTILYIIFGLLYFAFTAFTKNKRKDQNNPRRQRPEDATETLGPPPSGARPTFEELLEEFTTGRKREETVFVPADLESSEVIEVVEPEPAEIQRLEPKEDKDLDTTFERFEEFEEIETEKSAYAALLREPDGPKKAFVLSEIFNRKY